MKFERVGSPRAEALLRSAFWREVKFIPDGQKLKTCLQCGTCSGSCPVSYAMDITPRALVAMFRAGMIEEILQSRTIWVCASCYSCTVRCPAGIRVTDTLYALKRLAMEKKIYPNRFPVYALSKAFTRNIYNYGRNFEFGLAMRYYLRTGPFKLLANTRMGLTMMREGRMSLSPHRIKRVGEVRAIIDKAKQIGARV